MYNRSSVNFNLRQRIIHFEVLGGKNMKKVRVEDALGMILAHDLTKIEPGKFKGPAYKKGHVIQQEDIAGLKDAGKYHIYAMELNEDQLHEEDAALRIAEAVKGTGLYLEGPAEGKMTLKASEAGLLKVDVEVLEKINMIDMITLATLHTNTLVKKGQSIAGTRVVPLSIDKEYIEQIEAICAESGPILNIKQLEEFKAGVVVTGTEVYEGRIKDKFGIVLENKVKSFGSTMIGTEYAKDDEEMIKEKIELLIQKGANIILTSGGMSVDADDVTPIAIRDISDEVISYGSPVLPGAMFMVAYKGDIPIVGVPACGMYHRITVLDLILPRILAKEKITKRDMAALGHGGLCLNCEVCDFPVCPFGK